jgi:excisionase family DNA binding protein
VTATPHNRVDDYLSKEELGAYVQVHPLTLYRLAKAGKVKAVKVGGQWRFKKAWVDDMMQGAWGSLGE